MKPPFPSNNKKKAGRRMIMLAFIGGVVLGGILGIFLMCMMQISRE